MEQFIYFIVIVSVFYFAYSSYKRDKLEDKNLNLQIELEMEKQRIDVEKKYKKMDFYSLYDIQQGMIHKYKKRVKSWKIARKTLGNKVPDIWDNPDFIKEYAKLRLVTNIVYEKFDSEEHNDDLYYMGIPNFDDIEID